MWQHPHAAVEVEPGGLLLGGREHVWPHVGLHRRPFDLGVLGEELGAVLGRQVPLAQATLVLQAGHEATRWAGIQ